MHVEEHLCCPFMPGGENRFSSPAMCFCVYLFVARTLLLSMKNPLTTLLPNPSWPGG